MHAVCTCVCAYIHEYFSVFSSQILDLKKDYNDKLFTLRDKKIEVIAKVGCMFYMLMVATS